MQIQLVMRRNPAFICHGNAFDTVNQVWLYRRLKILTLNKNHETNDIINKAHVTEKKGRGLWLK